MMKKNLNVWVQEELESWKEMLVYEGKWWICGFTPGLGLFCLIYN